MDRGNKERTKEIVKKTKKCGFCPKHDGENRGRRERFQKSSKRRA